MPPEPRIERPSTSYHTMKVPGRPQPIASYSQTQTTTSQAFRSSKSSTPIASPRQPFSVGQTYAPKLSPSAARIQDARTPSPNYFGLSIDSTADPIESVGLPRENWSPQTSSVKSFAAAIPQQMPLDANPEFEAFRRQVDANRGHGFSLSTAQFGRSLPMGGTPAASTPSAAARPQPTRWHTHGNETNNAPPSRTSVGATLKSSERVPTLKMMDIDTGSPDSAYVSAESKRSSSTSLNQPPLNPPLFLNMGRHESPARFDSPFSVPEQRRSHVSAVDDRHPRLSMMQNRVDPPSPGPNHAHRAETIPAKLETRGPSMMSPSELGNLIEHEPASEILILDLRVSPQYAQSRIKGALNLCIPTTLLKRATFNLKKLQTTFQGEYEQDKFSNWQKTSYLVVYDAYSSDRRDAVSAMNMIKKFVNEGYSGSMNILRGGFNAFAANYPQLVDSGSSLSGTNGLNLGSNTGSGAAGRPTIAPVIGGVMLPMGGSNANPFFSNIRQNQDLVDGVGQMKVGLPAGLSPESLPQWVRVAADPADQGKRVSDKFLSIELAEQSRMKDAYSVFKPAKAGAEDMRVQLSGIEKGGKNRYKDILPFEHARVRLEGRPEGSCDYVNASHLKSSRSHKRYIASQGPLPATFDDFWSVIWDQDVRVIVMLTAESEGGQLKCHPYWQGKEFGPIKLRQLSEKKVSLDIDKHRSHSATPSSAAQSSHSNPSASAAAESGRRRANTTTSVDSNNLTPAQTSNAGETPYVIIRKMTLSHASHPFSPIREITQLHYPSWPDFGAPAQPSHLLALVELANVMQRAALPAGGQSTISSVMAEINSPETTGQRRPSIGKALDVTPPSWLDSLEPADDVRPMLVHCSAGCGRTGAFCTVDSVIDMLKRQRMVAADSVASQRKERRRSVTRPVDTEGDISMESPAPVRQPSKDALSFFPPAAGTTNKQNAFTKVNGPEADDDLNLSWLGDDTVDLIAATVEDFRGQRLSMVQSLRQFVLCYETVIEWLWRLQQGDSPPAGRGRARSGSLNR